MQDADLGGGSTGQEVAIIAMAGRFPRAKNVAEFWRNLRDGVESITFLTDEQLLAAGVDQRLLRQENYVRACAALEDIELFDASFFGFSPRDAAIMDPQHRLFLECAWEALESAGYDAERCRSSIGIYGGSGMNAYMMYHLLSNPQLMQTVGEFLIRHTGNDKDFLTTRVSYQLNLKGPSVNVQTACSTSLVAIHLACQGLLNGECDMALAGGVTINLPQQQGYIYKDGEILSPDGHCRAFDDKARGTIFGSGAGVVVLKRLTDALADGDYIHAVIKGSAVNNDGSLKVGYLAPSVEGQAAVVSEALTIAGVEAETISYVEAHGTGTPVGDPIEITALTRAFQHHTEKKNFCAVGSLKTNIGHLDTAAGVASLIKAVLALEHRQLPPSLHFKRPNPQIDFANSPFYVNAELSEWKASAEAAAPRRAGVTSLGVGGTNAHVILEEAPRTPPSGESRPFELLVLSAKTETALESATANLARHLEEHRDLNLADVAYTYQVGRKAFKHRRTIVCRDTEDALAALRNPDPKRTPTQLRPQADPSVVFMFPGGGAQYVNMGSELYGAEPAFRGHIDECVELLTPHLGFDLRSALFPADGEVKESAARLEKPSVALPALFATEYALARLLMSWGVHPRAMIGHSLGEYAAACLAGVISLEDALSLVALRGRLFETLPEGSMLSVPLPENELRALMSPQLSMAAINGPSLCVVSGPTEAIEEMERALAGREVECHRLHISVAAHSTMVESILPEFARFVERIRFRPPTIPYISNLTGAWTTAHDVTDPSYWVRHLRHTVRFADGVGELLQEPHRVLVEVGPGRTLGTLARQHSRRTAQQTVCSTLRHPDEPSSDVAFLLNALGRLWLAGAEIDWAAFHAAHRRRRLPLPTYPFERQRFWIEPGKHSSSTAASADADALIRKPDLADWFYQPVWKQVAVPSVASETASAATAAAGSESGLCWLVFSEASGLSSRITERLKKKGDDCITVMMGRRFARPRGGGDAYTINPEERRHYDALVQDLRARGKMPQRIIHLWAGAGRSGAGPSQKIKDYQKKQALSFYSLLHLAQALGEEELASPIHLGIVSDRMQRVAGETALDPEQATLLGPCRVIPQEFPDITCSSIDMVLGESRAWQTELLAEQLIAELSLKLPEQVVAYRGHDRWVQSFEPVRLEEGAEAKNRLREGGTYLITGGLGGLGFALAEHLAKTLRAKLVLVGRTTLPERTEWEKWLGSHDAGDGVTRRIRKVLSLEALGAEVMIASADVTNLKQMREAVARARARYGALHGVIHAAGIIDDRIIQLKSRDMAESVLGPKVRGALVLDALLRDVELDFFVLFSSISSLLGLAGQADYSAANAFLDAFAQRRTTEEGAFTLAINWGAWREVGMAAELLTSSRPAPAELSEKTPPREMTHPLLDHSIVELKDEEVFTTELSVGEQWILNEHRIRGGEALVPGAAYLEIVRAAVEKQARGRTIVLRDVLFLSPLVVRADERKRAEVRITRAGEAFDFAIRSRGAADNAGAWQEHVTGRISYGGEEEPAKRYAIDEILRSCDAREKIFTGEEQNRHLDFGPRWRNLRSVRFGKDEALAVLELPEEFAADLEDYGLHPSLLDMGTAGVQTLIEGYDEESDFYVPLLYSKVHIRGRLPGKVYSHLRYKETSSRQKGVAVFDVSMMDGDGKVLVEVEGFTLKKVDDKAVMTGEEFGRGGGQRSIEGDETSDAKPSVAAGQELLQVMLREGIAPAEGVEAFRRAVCGRLRPQLVVSSLDLVALTAQTGAARAGTEESAELKLARPTLVSTYAAPRDEFERALAALWEDLLGVDRVGVNDDFFDLGGHSLIAVRLFAKIKKTYKVDLGLATLFEAPTIERQANILRGGELRAPGEESAPPQTPAPRPSLWPLVVPIQPNGSKPPFFCIHGFGGNIVEYLHLARYLGPDQPFYGIQARGLDGKQSRLDRVEEMAAHYVREVRAFQPEGPYYFGGSSFGGIVGYEMAQQLRAQGEEVALLALFDTYGRDYPKLLPTTTKLRNRLNAVRSRLELHAGNLMLLELGEWPAYVSEKSGKARKMLKRRIRNGRLSLRRLLLPRAIRLQLKLTGQDGSDIALRGLHLPQAVKDVQAAGARAALSYVPQPYHGQVTLFRATNQPLGIYPDPTNGWGELAVGRLEIYDLPGHHGAIVREPRVRVLAERLNACLARAQASASETRSKPAATPSSLSGEMLERVEEAVAL